MYTVAFGAGPIGNRGYVLASVAVGGHVTSLIYFYIFPIMYFYIDTFRVDILNSSC
jgi:hypothetical protein